MSDGKYHYCFSNEGWTSNSKEVSFNVHGVVYVPEAEMEQDPLETEGTTVIRPYKLLHPLRCRFTNMSCLTNQSAAFRNHWLRSRMSNPTSWWESGYTGTRQRAPTREWNGGASSSLPCLSEREFSRFGGWRDSSRFVGPIPQFFMDMYWSLVGVYRSSALSDCMLRDEKSVYNRGAMVSGLLLFEIGTFQHNLHCKDWGLGTGMMLYEFLCCWSRKAFNYMTLCTKPQ